MLNCGTTKGGALEGWGPQRVGPSKGGALKGWGPQRVGPSKGGAQKGGAQRGGAPKGGGPKNSRFFFPVPPQFFFFCLSLGVFSKNYGGV